jgi:ferredoxin-NADP reductase
MQLYCTLQEEIVLVAGGVGVTPLMSTAGYLLEQLAANASTTSKEKALPLLKHVTFVWSARSQVCFRDWFPAEMTALLEANDVDVKLFQTCGERDSSVIVSPTAKVDDVEMQAWVSNGALKECLKAGRPVAADILSGVHKRVAGVAGKVAVLACGPERFVGAFRSAAKSTGAHFHSETFAL